MIHIYICMIYDGKQMELLFISHTLIWFVQSLNWFFCYSFQSISLSRFLWVRIVQTLFKNRICAWRLLLPKSWWICARKCGLRSKGILFWFWFFFFLLCHHQTTQVGQRITNWTLTGRRLHHSSYVGIKWIHILRVNVEDSIFKRTFQSTNQSSRLFQSIKCSCCSCMCITRCLQVTFQHELKICLLVPARRQEQKRWV